MSKIRPLFWPDHETAMPALRPAWEIEDTPAGATTLAPSVDGTWSSHNNVVYHGYNTSDWIRSLLRPTSLFAVWVSGSELNLHPQQVLLASADEALGDAVAFGLTHEERRGLDAEQGDLGLKSRSELGLSSDGADNGSARIYGPALQGLKAVGALVGAPETRRTGIMNASKSREPHRFTF